MIVLKVLPACFTWSFIDMMTEAWPYLEFEPGGGGVPGSRFLESLVHVGPVEGEDFAPCVAEV